MATQVLIGTVFVVAFVTIRAASFHHVDTLIGTPVAGLRMNWILELGGIACVALAALRATPPRGMRGS